MKKQIKYALMRDPGVKSEEETDVPSGEATETPASADNAGTAEEAAAQ